jgi:hypothetical protein
MAHLSIRDLQKISGEAISALPGPTAVKSGDRTVALLIPLKKPDPERLDAVLAKAKELAKSRDRAAELEVLATYGDVDLTEWTPEMVEAILSGRE